MNKIAIGLIVMVFLTYIAQSQNTVITDDASYTSGAASAMLDIKSTSKGLLIPRVTATQKGNISSPATGLLVYQTDGTQGFYYYNGSSWVQLETAFSTSSDISGAISDETGSGALVFGTAPTFTTSLTSPLVIGGTATTSDLSLKTTSGVGTTGADMHFLVGNNGATEAMTILNSGNVGIGTTSPSTLVHATLSAATNQEVLRLDNPDVSGAGARLDFYGNSSNVGRIKSYFQSQWQLGLGVYGNLEVITLRTSGMGVGTNDPGSLLSVAGGATLGDAYKSTAAPTNGLIVEGNVGLGTTAPQSLLDVQGAAGAAGILTLASKELTVVDGDQLGRINFNAPLESDGSDAILAGAAIWAEADATFSTTVNSTELVFGTATTTVAAEKMRLTSDGKLGIGTATPVHKLHVVGGNIALNNTYGVYFANTSETPASFIGMDAANHFSARQGNTSGSAYYGISSGANTTGDIYLQTAGANRVTIDQDGNVGIGTTPSEQLQITGNFRLPATTSTTGIIYHDGAPMLHAFGTGNLFIGQSAGNLTTSGSGMNVGIGYQSSIALTTGGNNTALGQQSLKATTTGTCNTAIGGGALLTNTTAHYNTAVGFYSANLNLTGQGNTAVGYYALQKNSTGHNNTAIGISALANAVTTAGLDENTAVGSNSMLSATTGAYNTALGSSSMRMNTTGSNNTAVGHAALYNSTASNNTVIGRMAGYYNVSGAYNTIMGYAAGQGASGQSNGSNTYYGAQAGFSTTTGSANVIMGMNAGYSLTTGASNVFLGYQAGYNETTGSNKLFIANSLNNPPLIYGDFSTGRVGLGTTSPAVALQVSKVSGTNYMGNIRISTDGLQHGLTILQENASYSNPFTEATVQGFTGDANDADFTGMLTNWGSGGGGLAIIGTSNFAGIPATAILANQAVDGTDNAAIFFDAAQTNGSTGKTSIADDNNVFQIANNATDIFTLKGDGDVGIGTVSPANKLHVYDASAAQLLVSGWSATQAGSSGGAGQILLGNTASSQGVIQYQYSGGDLFIDNTWNSDNGDIRFRTKTAGTPVDALTIDGSGYVGVGTTTPGYLFTVNGQPAANGYTTFTNYSDRRLKENITNLTTDGSSVLEKITKLRPVSYNYNSLTGYDEETRSRRISGFIAQELQTVFPEMVGEVEINGETYLDTDLSNLTLYLVEAIKEQQKMILSLQEEINSLKNPNTDSAQLTK